MPVGVHGIERRHLRPGKTRQHLRDARRASRDRGRLLDGRGGVAERGRVSRQALGIEMADATIGREAHAAHLGLEAVVEFDDRPRHVRGLEPVVGGHEHDRALPAAERLQVLHEPADRAIRPRHRLEDLRAVDAVPVRVTVRNETDRKVRLEAARLSLVDADGTSHEPLAGGALAGALANNAAGQRVRSELFGEKPIAARETRIGFLVYPPGKYREARVSIEDVETEESDGFVTPVE